ncbi:MAG: ribonuclease III [Pseudomonadota bacterium]
MSQPRSLQELELIIEYTFQDQALLRCALTHSSAIPTGINDHKIHKSDTLQWHHNNERLEFLGDRVLGLAISDLLIERFPIAPEGELARRFNNLVRKEACAVVAQEMKLGQFLIMGEGERESGGQEKPAILADACEAVLGALFLDGGFDAAKHFIRRLWAPKVNTSDIIPTDPKSALQEWAQSQKLALPKYIETKRDGPDHAPLFTTEVQIDGLQSAQGVGNSKRAAEQAAAKTMLQRECIWTTSEKS